MNRLLVVDDEPGILKAITRVLHGTEWKVKTATSAQEGLVELEFEEFDIVVSDYRMPEMNGVEFLTRVRKRWPLTVRVILSGYTDTQAILGSLNDAEIFRYLTKPWSENDLLEVLQKAKARRAFLVTGHELIEDKRRAQDQELRRSRELADLERAEPGITEVKFSPTDTICLDEDSSEG